MSEQAACITLSTAHDLCVAENAAVVNEARLWFHTYSLSQICNALHNILIQR